MMSSNRKRTLWIFAGLAGFTLLAFQNCSASLWSLTNSTPVKANSLNEMLAETENEINSTKKLLDEEQETRVYKAREIAREHEIDVPDARQNKNVRIKLKLKKPRNTQN